jgi:hypothetical protein
MTRREWWSWVVAVGLLAGCLPAYPAMYASAAVVALVGVL